MGRERLTKSVKLALLDQEFTVEVNFRTVDIIERAFDASAESVLLKFARNIERIRRGQIADVMVGWLQASHADMKPEAVREWIFTAQAHDVAPIYLTIMGALSYATRSIDEAAFEKILAASSPTADDAKKNTVSTSSSPAIAGASLPLPEASGSPPPSSGT